MDNFLKELACTSTKEEEIDFCRKKILHGTPWIFSSKEDEYYEFRKIIAKHFKISFHEVFITGSANLGFSAHKRTAFSYESDIDVAIVSPNLFKDIMEQIRVYQMQLRESRRSVTNVEIRKYHKFLEYTVIGWIRPDLLPVSFQMNKLKDYWFEFFTSISYGKSEVGNYKVSAGVFKSYDYLEKYTLSSIQSTKTSYIVGSPHE